MDHDNISSLSAGIHFQAEPNNDESFKKGKGNKKKKRTSQEKVKDVTKFGKIGGRSQAKSNLQKSPNIAGSQSISGTDLAQSMGDDITVSKSLTDLGDLPVPVKKANKMQVVSGWNDDGLIDDWDFDDINNDTKQSKQTVVVEKKHMDFDDLDDFDQYEELKPKKQDKKAKDTSTKF